MEERTERTEDRTALTDEQLQRIAGGNVEPLPTANASIFARAQEALGKPYVCGGVGPDGFDTEGLVNYCVFGVHAKPETTESFRSYPHVSNPVPGDICVNESHCGIYAGPGQMIHAPTFGGCVSYGTIPPDMVIVRY